MKLDYKSIGKRIRAIRENAGMSQESLAGTVNISVPHLSKIENGRTKFSLPVLVTIANTLNVSVDYFLCDNIHNSETIYHHDLYHLLQDCSSQELRIIYDTDVALKQSLRKNAPSPEPAEYDLLNL